MQRHFRVLLVSLVACVSVLLFAHSSVDSLWEGFWKADWGYYDDEDYYAMMTLLYHEDGYVTGEYWYKNYFDEITRGTIQGTSTEGVLVGTYIEGEYVDHIELIIDPDGRSFSGIWHEFGFEAGYWKGERAEFPFWVGNWDAAWGYHNEEPYPVMMSFYQDADGNVTGKYWYEDYLGETAEGIIQGVSTSGVLRGTYEEGDFSDRLELTLAPDGRSFRGRWYEFGVEAGYWRGNLLE